MIFRLFIFSLVFISTSAFACQDYFFEQPDERARTAIDEIFAQGGFESESPKHVTSVWLKLSEAEPDYLFIIPPDRCWFSNCPILGFRQMPDGWKKVYEEFGGDGIEVLDIKTDGHADLVQYEGDGADKTIEKTSYWTGDRYGRVTTKSLP